MAQVGGESDQDEDAVNIVVEFEPEALARMVQLDAVAPGALELIRDATKALERHPLIGRPRDDDLHELVISRGKSGYVALYEFNEPLMTVYILAVRHQREAGFR